MGIHPLRKTCPRSWPHRPQQSGMGTALLEDCWLYTSKCLRLLVCTHTRTAAYRTRPLLCPIRLRIHCWRRESRWGFEVVEGLIPHAGLYRQIALTCHLTRHLYRQIATSHATCTDRLPPHTPPTCHLTRHLYRQIATWRLFCATPSLRFVFIKKTRKVGVGSDCHAGGYSARPQLCELCL